MIRVIGNYGSGIRCQEPGNSERHKVIRFSLFPHELSLTTFYFPLSTFHLFIITYHLLLLTDYFFAIKLRLRQSPQYPLPANPQFFAL